MVTVRCAAESDLEWIRTVLKEAWGAPRIVSRGRVHQADALPTLIACDGKARVGLLTYRLDGEACEIVSLNSVSGRRGVGTRLLSAVKNVARDAGCDRLWLTTTNDNTPAVRFYQRRGFRIVAIHVGAGAAARELKPEIPETGVDGIAIRDEIELEFDPRCDSLSGGHVSTGSSSDSAAPVGVASLKDEVRRVFSMAPWEQKVGYCRAIRAGNLVFVTGTAPVDDAGRTFAPGEPYAQARRCFELIGRALEGLGADLRSVVRTRMFVTDISQWPEFGRAHHEFFAESPPATTMVEVCRLIDPAMLIEVEADAVVR